LAHRSQRDYRAIHAASFDEISLNGCAPIPGTFRWQFERGAPIIAASASRREIRSIESGPR
jgi:hypothetical protein